MSHKRNQFLDTDLSDEDNGSLHNSDNAEDARGSRVSGLTARSSKRQKLSVQDDSSSEDEVSNGSADPEHDSNATAGLQSPNADTPNDHHPLEENPPDPTAKPSPVKSQNSHHLPTPAQLANTQRLVAKTGVLYLSRIPPFMRPSTVRHLLSQHGTITRLFLTPEPASRHSSRLRAGGNKKRSFTDGWVEFASKRDAKICAESINGRIIGGKKGGWYHDDLWNVKYLRGFKWGDLMEGVRREERVREERLRVEVRREARERKAFLEGVERGKMERGMERQRQKRAAERDVEGRQARETERGDHGVKGVHSGDENVETEKEQEKTRNKKKSFERHFRQNQVKKKSTNGLIAGEQPDEVKRVLSKIF